jgi:iron-sulfur cluster insertion protein|tara:strand:+ start:76 stop:426 length:351 start_codon:yes stop_codon:yes gene_type:complete
MYLIDNNREFNLMSVVTLTQSAKDYMKSVCYNGDHVSLTVKSGGCSGMQYEWGLKYNKPDINWSKPIDNLLVIDPLAEMYLMGSEVDYVNELGGSFLTIRNPVSKSSCGCGESFGV